MAQHQKHFVTDPSVRRQILMDYAKDALMACFAFGYASLLVSFIHKEEQDAADANFAIFWMAMYGALSFYFDTSIVFIKKLLVALYALPPAIFLSILCICIYSPSQEVTLATVNSSPPAILLSPFFCLAAVFYILFRVSFLIIETKFRTRPQPRPEVDIVVIDREPQPRLNSLGRNAVMHQQKLNAPEPKVVVLRPGKKS